MSEPSTSPVPCNCTESDSKWPKSELAESTDENAAESVPGDADGLPP